MDGPSCNVAAVHLYDPIQSWPGLTARLTSLWRSFVVTPAEEAREPCRGGAAATRRSTGGAPVHNRKDREGGKEDVVKAARGGEVLYRAAAWEGGQGAPNRIGSARPETAGHRCQPNKIQRQAPRLAKQRGGTKP